ncbi:MAG: hypothetical protein EON91_00410 [Brevundimonas sp.]|uniref:hypothetical protein n=1 Tax=Brevundimonas sp. TaxID=1871086 RepID=UPI00121360F0|nr:hypothetical protein [Brevundimonas sp.]RZJ19723.1 MAG: hypothetical protein EON91_00410 [Brevundimonas sp.]
MKQMFSATLAVFFIAVSSITSCAQKSESVEPLYYVLTPGSDDVFGIPIDETFASISDSFEVVEAGEGLREGDPYNFLVVKVADELNVKIGFDGVLSNGRSHVYNFETRSSLVRDPYGLGVGSDLGRVMDAWPNGRVVSGLSDAGKYARYWTGTEIIFLLNPGHLEESCFIEYMPKCNIPRSITVEGIAVYPRLPDGS